MPAAAPAASGEVLSAASGQGSIPGVASLGPRARILAVTTDFRLTGAKRVLVDGAVGIDRSRFDPSVLLLSPVPASDPLRRELDAAGIPVHHVPVRSRLHVRGLRALRRWLEDVARPDLVHTHCSRSAGVVRLACRLWRDRPRIVVHFHGTVTARSASWRHRLLDRMLRSTTDLVLTPTHHSASRGARVHFFAGRPLTVLPNGVDLAHLEHPERTREQVRSVWGVAGGDRVVLLLGRWGWTKGHDVLLDAIPEVLGHDEPVKFVFVGPPGVSAYRDRLERRVSNTALRRHVVLVGEDTDPAGCYVASDVVTMPSRDEPFGLVAVEAMAVGRTLVAARVPGLSEVAGDDGGVIWTEPSDAGALARGLLFALSEPPEARAERAALHRARARRFGLDAYLSGLMAAYESVLGPVPAGAPGTVPVPRPVTEAPCPAIP